MRTDEHYIWVVVVVVVAVWWERGAVVILLSSHKHLSPSLCCLSLCLSLSQSLVESSRSKQHLLTLLYRTEPYRTVRTRTVVVIVTRKRIAAADQRQWCRRRQWRDHFINPYSILEFRVSDDYQFYISTHNSIQFNSSLCCAVIERR